MSKIALRPPKNFVAGEEPYSISQCKCENNSFNEAKPWCGEVFVKERCYPEQTKQRRYQISAAGIGYHWVLTCIIQ